MRPLPPLYLLAGLFLVAPSPAADEIPSPEITSFTQLWQAGRSTVPQTKHHVHMDVVVLYHDALWKSMWVRCGTTNGYLGFAEVQPQMRPGQHILIEAELHPAEGTLLAAARLTPLGDDMPLSPIDARGRMDQAETLHTNLITIEGLVDRQTDKDAAHLNLDLIVEGRLVTIWLPHVADAPMPQMENAIVRATGVFCATANPAGQFTRLELCVQSPRELGIVGWIDRDSRFAAAPSPIQDLATAPPDKLMHVAGLVRAAQPGRSVTLRDETGQVTINSPQTHPIQLGERFEAIGYARTAGAELQLDRALLRRAQQIASEFRGLPRLRLAAQLRDLPVEDADRGYPVQLAGVVTWSHPDSEFFFILDASGGARVHRPADGTPPPQVGDKVEVVGLSALGSFAPDVRAQAVHRAGKMDLPDARPVTLEQALTGVEEAQWVAMSGFVRDLAVDGTWLRLELGTPAGPFTCLLPNTPGLGRIRGAVVRLRGVCSAVANEKRQLNGIQLWVPDTASLAVEEPCPADPYAIPERSIASLRQFGALLALTRRVRISGIVTGQVPGRLLHVQDGADGLLVLSRETDPLEPGDRVEVVGFPGRDRNRVVLHEAIYRKVDRGTEPPPLLLAALRPIAPEADGRLVRIDGRLLEVSPQELGTRLTVQNETGVLEALLERPLAERLAGWTPGSLVALTGVYEVRLDEYRHPSSAVLLLRTPADVAVHARPPWWTVRRALGTSAVLALGTLLGFAWIVALRRRVRRQTELIREQFEKEKAARIEATLVRTSKLESLGLLAGGIAHDFNNLLTVVICNLSLLKLGRHFDPETEQCINDSTRASLRARDLTQQLLTFAKGGDPICTTVALPLVIRESGEFARHGSKIRCLYDFADQPWPARVDKGQIGQVVHNLVLNAAQAMPEGGVVIISLRNAELAPRTVADLPPGRYLQLTIADQGSGIPPEVLPRIFEPYFTTKRTGNGLGLATVHSIVRKHQGHIEVSSLLGKGTTFTLWLPAAPEDAPAAVVHSAETPPQLAGRILFMDDEEPIRRAAALLCTRLGLETVAVEDGAAALREYAAAQAAGRPFAAVVLDLTVPGGLGGSDTIAALRQLDPNVCAIVSSGYASDPVLARYRDFGFKAMIRKPYEAMEVAQILAQVLPAR